MIRKGGRRIENEGSRLTITNHLGMSSNIYHLIFFVSPSSFFFLLVRTINRTATCISLTPCVCLRLGEEAFAELITPLAVFGKLNFFGKKKEGEKKEEQRGKRKKKKTKQALAGWLAFHLLICLPSTIDLYEDASPLPAFEDIQLHDLSLIA